MDLTWSENPVVESTFCHFRCHCSGTLKRSARFIVFACDVWIKVPFLLSVVFFIWETLRVGLPADSALTSACTSWLLLTVNRCVTLMTDVIHWIYWPDVQTESIICLLLLTSCFFFPCPFSLLYMYTEHSILISTHSDNFGARLVHV